MVCACVEAVRQRPVNAGKCGTDAKVVIALWRCLDYPDPVEFAAEFALVARAARECPAKLFARDIRAEGWDGGTDRAGDVSTVAVQCKWGDRLAAAQAWRDGTRQPTPAGPLVNGSAAAWALVTGWVADCHVGKRAHLPTDTPEAIRIVTAFCAAGGRRRYERERNVEPMMLDFARHLGHG